MDDFWRKGFLMVGKILLVAAVCCAPSVFYLVYILGKYLNRWLNRHWPALSVEDITQLILVMVSIICFGLSLFLVVLNFVTPIPYYHRGKSLIIALLFLLMGILCIQVFQFVRWQSHQKRPQSGPVARRPVQKSVVRGFVTTNQKG
jgi:uncharacterized membrane protein